MLVPSVEPGTDARTTARTNVFLGAVLRGANFAAPVKIRNMSLTGALVEGATLPEAGLPVRLVRGSLVAQAEVAWTAEGRCGLRLVPLVSVRDWIAPLANQEQQRIDDAVRLLKAGITPLPLGSALGGSALPSQLGQELRDVVHLLDAVSAHLASNEATMLVHGDEMQNLDIAVQILDTVGTILTGDADEFAALSRLDNLRRSCREALERFR